MGLIITSTQEAFQTNQIWRRSTDLADHFKKPHDRLLQSIDAILRTLDEIAPDERASTFHGTFQTTAMPNGATRQDRMYLVSEKGYALLASSFTGKKMMPYKIQIANILENQRKQLLDHAGFAHKMAERRLQDCKLNVAKEEAKAKRSEYSSIIHIQKQEIKILQLKQALAK